MRSPLLSPCEVKLHLLQSAIYLSQPPATKDVVARGLLELYEPSGRRITDVKVRLRAVQTVVVLGPLTGNKTVD
ncbi:hypothetical protein OC844_007600 [Tilletia horrida]|nr:hypothetical protein OC844_007600 [Tilletia horrida]